MDLKTSFSSEKIDMEMYKTLMQKISKRETIINLDEFQSFLQKYMIYNQLFALLKQLFNKNYNRIEEKNRKIIEKTILTIEKLRNKKVLHRRTKRIIDIDPEFFKKIPELNREISWRIQKITTQMQEDEEDE